MVPSPPKSDQNGMFHTFQGVKPPKRNSSLAQSGKSGGNKASTKRITTPHACAECKRRKIRCDGQAPCSQCLSSRAPKKCFYDQHRQRVIPSRKTVETLNQSLSEYRSVLKKIFPSHELSMLLPLSREELLTLLGYSSTEESFALPSPSITSYLSAQDLDLRVTGLHDEITSDEEQLPPRISEWDDKYQQSPSMEYELGDLNYSAAAVDSPRPKFDSSSINDDALWVMAKLHPQLRATLLLPLNGLGVNDNIPIIRRQTVDSTDASRILWSWKGQTLIDAYFKKIQVFIPMIDEATFRSNYLDGRKADRPWLALLNMVFAMGSIVATKADDSSHVDYYNSAMDHLTVEMFGSSHLETVQALAIMGGYYLHYVNRPNMANAILGAAMRMASALGLHRESLLVINHEISAAETRRRTWWSLFCLDTWANTITRRPSFGRCGPAINTQPPAFGIEVAADSTQYTGILPLIENIKFCKIATQIQDILAANPLLEAEDRFLLDRQLLRWYDELPWMLRANDPCTEPLYIARCIMKWRYKNLRMLLHRPILLKMASNADGSEETGYDLASVDICQKMAQATIEDIAREWARNQMSSWNAVWFLYQAVMVPLLCISQQRESSLTAEWQKQVETTLDLLEAMEDWSVAAQQTREIILRIYEATHQYPTLQDPNFKLNADSRQGLLQYGNDDVLPLCMGADELDDMLGKNDIWDLEISSWCNGRHFMDVGEGISSPHNEVPSRNDGNTKSYNSASDRNLFTD